MIFDRMRRKPEEASAAAAAGSTAPVTGGTVEQAGQLRFASIESLRALAALGVVWTHVYVGAEGIRFGDDSHYGIRLLVAIGYGAYFLFALSGCLIYLPFAKRHFGRGRDLKLKNYFLNRLFRLGPLYYFSLFVVFAIQGLALVEGNAGSPRVWAKFGTFTQNWFADTTNRVNEVLWTVCVEVQFYLLLPLIAWIVWKLARGSAYRAFLLLLIPAAVSITIAELVVSGHFAAQSERIRFSLIGNFDMIAAGMLVALLYVQWTEYRRPGWLRGVLANRGAWMLASVPFWMLSVADNINRTRPTIGIASFLLMGAVMLPLDGTPRVMRFLEWKRLATFGLCSYSLYVWHVPIIRIVTDEQTNSLGSGHLWPQLFVVLAISIPVAWISYKLIEVPGLRLRSRWDGEPGGTRADEEPQRQPATAGT